jgi:hypothetical protein
MIKTLLYKIVKFFCPSWFKGREIFHYVQKPHPEALAAMLRGDAWAYFIDQCKREYLDKTQNCKTDKDRCELTLRYEGVVFVDNRARDVVQAALRSRIQTRHRTAFGLSDDELIQEMENAKKN